MTGKHSKTGGDKGVRGIRRRATDLAGDIVRHVDTGRYEVAAMLSKALPHVLDALRRKELEVEAEAAIKEEEQRQKDLLDGDEETRF